MNTTMGLMFLTIEGHVIQKFASFVQPFSSNFDFLEQKCPWTDYLNS